MKTVKETATIKFSNQVNPPKNCRRCGNPATYTVDFPGNLRTELCDDCTDSLIKESNEAKMDS